ncbi:phosphopantetheine-binding protein [Treponema bryantii]|uniref:phosphopantetheine-binding protein n=1 Tax=Treponema bryantii TaxID=163 RepID=UPI002B2F1E9A|nr:hypothetical protein TRBR_26730 [Treponema bryantii]
MKEELIKIIRQNLSEIKEDEDIEQIENLCDYGLTSVVLISMIINIEKAFNIEIKDEDLLFKNFLSVNTIMETLKKYNITNL